MTTVPCTIMRGGTSKGVFFKRSELPESDWARDEMLLRILGSPDARQIDGLGGADPLTSKIVIMDPEAPEGCDATYTFGQVGVEEAYIRYSANCGNLSAAAAVYALEEGYVAADPSGTTTVRLYNSNTDRILVIHVPTENGGYCADGPFKIAGVPGSGAEIRLDFAATIGSATGKLLPLGVPRVSVDVPQLGQTVDISVVDVAKVTTFFHAEVLGLTGTEGPDDLNEDQLNMFWHIRDAAAALLGMGPEWGHLPTPVAVAPPADYTAYGTGTLIHAADMDFCARRVHGPPPRLHKAFAATGATCAAVAAVTPGTVVNDLMPDRPDDVVRLGHPTGVMPLRARYHGGTLVEASFSRTARRLLDGTAYIP